MLTTTPAEPELSSDLITLTFLELPVKTPPVNSEIEIVIPYPSQELHSLIPDPKLNNKDKHSKELDLLNKTTPLLCNPPYKTNL